MNHRILLSFLLLAALGATAGCGRRDEPTPQAGMPLLAQKTSDFQTFHDEEVGIRFNPPGNWSQQMRSTEEAGDAQGERPIVKYKRLLEGYKPAWLKVSVLRDPNTPLADLLVKKSPGPGFKQVGGVEQLALRGLPAAKITFRGKYDQYEDQDFTREIVAVRRGDKVFFFSGTYTTSDTTAQRRIRTAIESMDWDTGETARN